MEERRARIAFIIDNPVSEYACELLGGVKAACKDLNLDLLIFSIGKLHDLLTPYNYQYAAVTALISKNNIDGIVFASGTQMHFLTSQELSSYVQSFHPLPIVNISSPFAKIPSVYSDCKAAYKCIIENLVYEQNCKTFGILGIRSNSTEAEERLTNIKNCLKECNVPEENITYGTSAFDYVVSLQELESYWEKNLSFPFDAVLTLNDDQAMACLDFCKKHKIKIPKDVCVVGFDDIHRASCTNPALSTINQNVKKQGYKAVEILLEILEGKKVEPVTLIEATPVFRKSTQRNHYSPALKNSSFVRIEEGLKNTEFYDYASSEWYTKKGQFYQVTNYYTEIQSDMTLSQLQIRLNTDLMGFGITGAAIVVFNTPIEKNAPFDYFNLPHKAFVLSAYDKKNGVSENGLENREEFDPNNCMLPEGLLEFDSDGVVICSLFHNSLQYGYMIYRPGDYDSSIYDLLSKILSTIIASVYSRDLVNDEKDKIEAKFNKLGIVASTDELTGLLNRRGIYETGETTLKFAKAMNQNGLVIYSDMDGLKKINDNYGHEAGDRAIIAESIILRGNVRSNDLVARIGGDEFAMICPGLTMENFIRIKEQIDNDCVTWSETSEAPFILSISMGAIEYPSAKSNYDLAALFAEADHFLYEEKRKKHGENKR